MAFAASIPPTRRYHRDNGERMDLSFFFPFHFMLTTSWRYFTAGQQKIYKSKRYRERDGTLSGQRQDKARSQEDETTTRSVWFKSIASKTNLEWQKRKNVQINTKVKKEKEQYDKRIPKNVKEKDVRH